MADITLGGNTIHTAGNIPQPGDKAPEFQLTGNDLNDVKLSNYKGKKVILNIFPSIDTGVCAASVRRFNQEAANIQNAVVLNISKDLPFAQKRFCAAEGIENVEVLSEFRNQDFSDKYKVTIKDGPMAGLMSRAVVVLDEDNKVLYSEQVPEIKQEPNYEKALNALK